MKLKPATALYLARGVEASAYAAAMPFLLLHFMENFGYSALVSGTILGIREMVPIFTSAAMGWAAGRLDRKKMLVGGLFFLGLSAIEFWKGWGGLPGLSAAALVSGLAFGTMRVAFASSIPDILEPQETAQGYAMLHAAVNVGFVLGPFLSAYWVAKRDYGPVIALAVFLYFLNTVLVHKLIPKLPRRPAAAEKERGVRELFASFGRWGILFLSCLFLFSFLNGIRSQVHLMGLAKYFADFFHLPSGAPMYWVIQGALVAVFVPITGRLMKGWRLPKLFAAFALGGLTATLGNTVLSFFPAAHPLLALSALIALTTLGEVFSAPCLGAIFFQLGGSRHIGFLIGISHTLMALGLSLGSLFGGAAMERAIQTGHFPHYWLSLASLYLPVGAFLACLGFLALHNAFKMTEPREQPAVSG